MVFRPCWQLCLLCSLALWLLAGCGLSEEKKLKRSQLVRRGLRYYQAGKYRNAYQQFFQVLEIDPDHQVARSACAWCLYFLNKLEAAEKEFLLALEQDSADFRSIYGLGNVYFKKAVKLNRLLRRYQREQQYARSHHDTRRVSRLEEEIQALKPKVNQYLDKSFHYLQKAYRQDAKYYYISQQLAYIEIYRGLDYYPRARKYLEDYINNLEHQKEALHKLELKARKAQIDAAADEAKRSSYEAEELRLRHMRQTHTNEQRLSYILLGWLYFKLASREWQRQQANPDPQHQAKIKAYSKQAEAYIRQALTFDPHVPNQYVNLARLEAMQGHWQQAAKHLDHFLKKYPLADRHVRAQARVMEQQWREKSRSQE